jgi:hypothetical protein
LGRTGAHPRIGARALACVCVAGLAVVLGGCGSGDRQDKDEPSGKFPVQLVTASFPAQQRLATTSNMTVVVRNPGPKRVPVISVTVKCADNKGGSGGSPSNTGGGSGGFAYRTTSPGVADPARPRFVVNTIPTRTPRQYDKGRLDPLERSSAYVDTFPLGSLAAGRTVSFHWNVTAVRAGKFRICFQINAGLDGKAKAVPARAGEKVDGEFVGVVKEKPPQAHIAQDGKTVVEGKAVSESAP